MSRGDGGGEAPRRAWIATVSPEEATGPLAEVYGRVAGNSGAVSNILASESLRPEALDAHYALYRTLMFGHGTLARAEREAIAVVVSTTNGCGY